MRRRALLTAAAGVTVATTAGTASAAGASVAGSSVQEGATASSTAVSDTAAATTGTSASYASILAHPAGGAPSPVKELTPFLDPLTIPPTARPTRGADGVHNLTVEMRTATVSLHSQLPPTVVWAYEGHAPGPTIDVRRGERLRVAWVNRLTGTIPLTAVQVPNAQQTPAVWDQPGRGGAAPMADIRSLRPWPVTHLHGALTGSGNDGWPENVLEPGAAQVSEYRNDQPATALFYHDHAMAVTRWSVMAGLQGMYIVRDDEEDALGLPGGRYEVPLLLADRNLETDADGNLTGRLLHKTVVIQSEPLLWLRAFTGPFTLVNGTVWPYLEVKPRWYRFRVVNGANTRQYRLALVDEDGKPVPSGSVYQIGTDGGLLPRPIPVDDGVTLAAAERADLLIDFSAFRGRRLRLVNTNGNPDPGPWPQVMEFRVSSTRVSDPFVLPKRLSRSYKRLTESNLPGHTDRLVVLTPQGPGQALCWEMEKTEDVPEKLPTDGIVQVREKDGIVATYRRTAADFYDPVRFFVRARSWERWRFLHVAPSGWAHPMHIHTTSFQILERQTYDVSGFKTFTMADGSIGCGTATPVVWTGAGTVLPAEEGWKDTVRANAGELVTVVGYFGDTAGKYVYHCHMLEHEDMGMMRQFVVLPGQIQDVMASMEHMGMGSMDDSGTSGTGMPSTGTTEGSR
ncbi:multicopper oxidase domain-containing protein [Streptomyces tuirus]|uniref:Multicopper oxidase domain-containing protein n=1 Tax=Streptomyces tuirus TaxID=68278 RepID=A0A941FAN0_9ACTN|nr:multicopper oxidase domain-containing protein [Streptomyces tuirus]